jgi:hypothetical protein
MSGDTLDVAVTSVSCSTCLLRLRQLGSNAAGEFYPYFCGYYLPRLFAGAFLRSSGTLRGVRHHKKIPASIRSPGNLVIIRLVYDYRES